MFLDGIQLLLTGRKGERAMARASQSARIGRMQVSFSSGLDDGRETRAIGRVRASARWRAASPPGSDAEREAVVEALKREAAEYGADAIVDVRFEVDAVSGADIDGVALQRVTVTGMAVRFARAA
jgi:uncharacterized protein YbjQ (UPF0145 family)